MNRKLRRRIAEIYEEKLAGAISAAIAHKPENLAAIVSDVAIYAKLVKLSRPRWKTEATAAIVVGLLCAGIAALTWSIKIQTTEISLNADTSSVTGKLRDVWKIEHAVDSQLVHIAFVNSLYCSNLGLGVEEPSANSWVTIRGDHIRLETLEVHPNASLDIVSDEGQLTLFIGSQPFKGKLTVVGKGTIEAGVGEEKRVTRSYRNEIPEIINFERHGKVSVPAKIAINTHERWDLGAIALSDLNFSYESSTSPTESRIVSGLKRGQLDFTETTWGPVKLLEKQGFSIAKISEGFTYLSGEESLIHLTLNGIVGGVRVGGQSSGKELSPSYLEYLYAKKSISLFWAAVVFVWGVLWSIRRTIFA